jgi:outer membrane receptor for monomeric catechols
LTLLTSYQQDNTKNSQALPKPGTLTPNPSGVVPINRFTGEPDFDEVDRTEYSIGYELEHVVNQSVTLRQNFRYNYVDLDDSVVFSNGIEPDLRTIIRGAFGNFGELDGFALDNQALMTFESDAVSHTVLAGIDYQYTDARSTQSFGGAPSIDISTGATKGTTITRNLIYGEATVLRLVPPTKYYTPAPVILSYDPAGTVRGIACPGCEIEIFSNDIIHADQGG